MDERKKALRKELKQVVASLTPEYCKEADEAIHRNVISMPEYQAAKTIFCYVGTKDEINTTPMILDALNQGKVVGVPKCVAKGIMEVYAITSMDDLQEGLYGIMEPKEGTKKIEPEELDFVMVPCLSAAKDGRRLGYGGGYYDRYLPKVTAEKAVLCRSKVMCEDIVVDVHDQVMRYVICEDGILRN